MVLPQFCPWKSHIYELEEELSTEAAPVEIKYVLYEDSSGKWRIQCVSVNASSFDNRLSMPEPVTINPPLVHTYSATPSPLPPDTDCGFRVACPFLLR